MKTGELRDKTFLNLVNSMPAGELMVGEMEL